MNGQRFAQSQSQFQDNFSGRNVSADIGGQGMMNSSGPTSNSSFGGVGNLDDNSVMGMSRQQQQPLLSPNSSNTFNTIPSGAHVPFDMSEFPSLGGQGRLASGENGGYPMSLGRQDFAIQSEDFPALGGSGVAANTSRPGGDSRFFEQQQQQQQQHNRGYGHPEERSQQHQQHLFDSNEAHGQKRNGYDGPGLVAGSVSSGGTKDNGGVLKGVSSGSAQQEPGKKRSVLAPEQQFGLLGLLSVIRKEEPERGILALGTDLTSLGLNLNSSESLHASFTSPWSDHASSRDPQYSIPACYPTAGKSRSTIHPSLFSKIRLESLFYAFYSMPRDAAQVLAAQELYNRDWRYHQEHKVWFAQATAKDGPFNTSEGPHYVFFDTSSWERRLFNNAALSGSLQAGFLPSSALSALTVQSANKQLNGPNQQKQQTVLTS